MSTYFVDVLGYPCDFFVIKELAIISEKKFIYHDFLRSPFEFDTLIKSYKTRSSIEYRRHYIPWSYGQCKFSDVQDQLAQIITKDSKIYVCSKKSKIINPLFDNTKVVEMPIDLKLKEVGVGECDCFFHDDEKPECALKNVFKFKKTILLYLKGEEETSV